MRKVKEELIGYEGVARRGFPPAYDKNTEGQTIKMREHYRVTDYDAINDEYMLLNLSIGNEEAWFKVSEEELKFILREAKLDKELYI